MPINITDPQTNITKSHYSERLEINLIVANEKVEDMEIVVYFNIHTLLGDVEVAPKYWDGQKPLILTCKGNPELTEAMKIIQNAIGVNRYLQITTPEPEIPLSSSLEVQT